MTQIERIYADFDMKKIIIIFLALFFSLNAFAQTERLSLSERNRIFNSIRSQDCSVDSVLNAFRKKLLKVVLFEMISAENTMFNFEEDISEEYVLYVIENEDFDDFEILISLTRGDSFFLEQFSKFDFSSLGASRWNLLEFYEYICVNQAIPFHLIEFVFFSTNIFIDEYESILGYTLKVTDLDNIEITSRQLIPLDECKN